MFRYAQVYENGYVVSDSHLSGVVTAGDMIPLAPDFDLTNKRWNGTGWEEYEHYNDVDFEPTQLDRIEVAINRSNDEISEKAIDTYTKQLLESGLL